MRIPASRKPLERRVERREHEPDRAHVREHDKQQGNAREFHRLASTK
jgi:hypothetical protein